jgi:hypothetical protein
VLVADEGLRFMASARHHTVSAFLLDRFARETERGRRVCMLEKATGRPRQVSPRDAAVQKHFYSLDTDAGRDAGVESVLGVIESEAAPVITQLDSGGFPHASERLSLALFITMCWCRTPAWRKTMGSVMEQMAAAMVSEVARLDPTAAQRALAETEATPEEIEEFRRTFIRDLDSGDIVVSMPKNAMIGHFLDSSTNMAWIVYMFDWTLVQLDDGMDEFIIGDNPVSLYDPNPVIPGGGIGLMSSPWTQTFLPLGPRRGLLLTPNEKVWSWWRANGERFKELTNDARWDEVLDREGIWAEGVPTEAFALDLNLRTYAHADRFVFGSQKAVQVVRSARRSHGARLGAVAPRGPRMHLVEGDPRAGLRIMRTFAPGPRLHP